MSDIERRIQRHRLSRFAPPGDPVHRRLRWFWLLALLWLVWTGLLSDHSFYRLWRLSAEQHRTQREIEATRATLARLDQEQRDPAAQRERAERLLRDNGMARPGEIVYRIGSSPTDSLAR